MSNAAHVTALRLDAHRAGLRPVGMGRKALAAWWRFHRYGIVDPAVVRAARYRAVPLVSRVPVATVRVPWWARAWRAVRRWRIVAWVWGRVD